MSTLWLKPCATRSYGKQWHDMFGHLLWSVNWSWIPFLSMVIRHKLTHDETTLLKHMVISVNGVLQNKPPYHTLHPHIHPHPQSPFLPSLLAMPSHQLLNQSVTKETSQRKTRPLHAYATACSACVQERRNPIRFGPITWKHTYMKACMLPRRKACTLLWLTK